MTRRLRIGAAALLAVGALTAPAQAATPELFPNPPSTTKAADPAEAFMLKHNLYHAAAKLGRGVANVLTGWVEIPIQMQNYYVPNDTGTSLFTGAAVGLARGVIRTGVGAYETVTFFLPYPEGFAPILPPLEHIRSYTPPGSTPSGESIL